MNHSKSRKIVLINHADTSVTDGSFLGLEDLPVSDKGKKDLEQMRPAIKIDMNNYVIYTSTLKRAIQSADILFPNAEKIENVRLNEIDFGDWSGKKMNDIMREFPEEIKSWMSDYTSFAFPGGESISGFFNRLQECSESILKNTDKNLILVCHGGVIRHLICHYLGLPYNHHMAFTIDRPSINIIDHFGKNGVLRALNLKELSE
ncbi:MAG: histidine phosphatase family protein [Leptospirales bacterium]